MEEFLRSWQQEALSKQQYDSAIFIGNKLLAMTNSESDAIALAQIHFTAGNYTRALSLIDRPSPACKYLSAQCLIKQNKHDDALILLGDHVQNGRKRPGRKQEKTEAGMCYLRGLCYAKQNAFDRAKDCYKDAVLIDVQCFEAFDQLTKNSLMSPGEEWDFLNTLDFGTGESSDFIRNLYITRLSKYSRPEEFASAIETLSTHFKLADNADILQAKAELLFTTSRYKPALEITSRILEADQYNFTTIPLHLALLHHLKDINTLFTLSHDLADNHPHEPCTWLAVGTYYLTTKRIPEARSYFSKASLMDPHFGPAWIGFAHTFAAEGEGDQAIAAYSTAARLFQGTHLPQMFLGMQELALGNLGVAKEYLNAAYEICDRDPLLLNESGVVEYMVEDWNSAIRRFQLALAIAKDNGGSDQYLTTRTNLAQAYRKAGKLEQALGEFDEVIRLGCRECGVFSSKALVLLELNRLFEAVTTLHEALAINPQDAIASELLVSALRLLQDQQSIISADEELLEENLRDQLVIARQRNLARSRKGRHRGLDAMDLDENAVVDV